MIAESFRLRTYRVLDAHDRETGRIINVLLMLLIIANVTAVMLESVRSIEAVYRTWFLWFEILSVAVFTVEYLARLWSVTESQQYRGLRGRLRYALTPMMIVDLLAILPFYLGMFMNIDTRFLRALRLLRVFKLARHSTSMDLMLTVMRNEAATVASSLFVMLIIIIMAASGIYIIERDAQPNAFQSIPHAMWWAAVTLTTVGYGDVVPITLWGKVFGLVITVAGVGMVALPAGILASGFSQELQKRRSEYQMYIKESLVDGRITRREMTELESTAGELGLRKDVAQMLIREETSQTGKSLTCPKCGTRF